MKKNLIILVFFIISIGSFYFYRVNQLPPGIEPKGNENYIALISLITAIVTFLATLLTLVLKIIELKSQKQMKS